MEGLIVKALSGFYYVRSGSETLECRARGRFRLDGTSPLVGDRVCVAPSGENKGTITELLPRRNCFVRPAVANVDQLVMIGANVNPVTAPFLIDRIAAFAELNDCETVVCLNKCDADPADALFAIYQSAGFPTVRTSAATGEGMDELKALLKGKISAFTGNSGVGKSSILNRLLPELGLKVGEVSEKLGRGKHTTRHVELFALGENTFVADTPGFASFDVEQVEPIGKERLPFAFREFDRYFGDCRFHDCTHRKEPDCAVRAAVERGEIQKTRYESYLRLYETAAKVKEWETT